LEKPGPNKGGEKKGQSPLGRGGEQGVITMTLHKPRGTEYKEKKRDSSNRGKWLLRGWLTGKKKGKDGRSRGREKEQ